MNAPHTEQPDEPVPGHSSPLLYNLVYCSRATEGVDAAAVDQIIATSRRYNPARSITGLLVFGSGIFFQWLEGPRDSVLALMALLKKDPRHHTVVLLTSGEEVRERLFPDWDMELVTGDDVRNVLEDALDQVQDAGSAQVLRAMLREPGRAWRVTELSETSGVSLGHVSNVRTGLIDREWAHASDDGLVLSDPNALLDAWRDSYSAPLGERLRFYTPLHGSALEDASRSAMRADDSPGRAAFASFSAAQWLSPYGRTGTHYFFADDEGLRKLREALKLTPTSKGENVVVIVPKDLGLLSDTVEPAPGAVCTSPVQTYLDLSIAGERGAEAADHLRRERLSWLK